MQTNKKKRTCSSWDGQRMINMNVEEYKTIIILNECPNFEGTCTKEDVDEINDNAMKLLYTKRRTF